MNQENEVLSENQAPETSVPPEKKAKKKHIRSGREYKYQPYPHAVVVVALAFLLVPLYIMTITSFMSNVESQEAQFHWWPRLGFTSKWYESALTQKVGSINFIIAFKNTMMMYLPSVIIGVLVSAMSAYAFAKIDFKLSKPMFAILLATMTLPNSLNTIVSYLIFDYIYWTDTPLPIMIPRMMGGISCVFFLRQYYMGVPDDIVGAAEIDGLNEIGVFTRIMLPIGMPAIFAQFMLTFIGAYNDYLGPLLYLSDARLWTMALLIAKYGDNGFIQLYAQKMAGAVVGMIPLVVLYFVAQKYILKGISITSGLKG